MFPQKLTTPSGKEAELYRRLPNGRIQCTACARLCQIAEGQVGLCGIRGVVNDRLYLLAYGKIITGHIDPIEKKPVVHYRPGSKIFSVATTGCNWLCHPAGTKVLLSDGNEGNIETLLPGDTVWSYDTSKSMRISPSVVTHVGTRLAQVWEIRYGNHDHGKLLLTEEHPVLTKSGWKTAGRLRPGEAVLRVWRTTTEVWKEKNKVIKSESIFNCQKCGERIRGLDNWNRHRGLCYTGGIVIPPEELERRRESMKFRNPMKNPEIARRALQSSKERFAADPAHGWHRNVAHLQMWLHRDPSVSQQKLYTILDELGIAYAKEFKIKVEKPLEGSKTYYIADAAFLDSRLDIEVDGWWHYNNAGVMKQDRIRDETLRANGWNVLRISGSYLFNHPEESKSLIAQRLVMPVMMNMRYWVTVKSVRRTDRFETVYSPETVPNHNYVVNGLLVHNCNYCQNFDISQRRKIEGVDASPEDVAGMAASHECEGLAYTYNEPTIFIEYAKDIGRIARQKGIFNIFVSNGFDTPETVGMMKDFLDCITVDFKGSGKTEFVRKYIGIPSADPIYETLLEIKRKTRIHIEITDLIVPEVGDDLEAAKKLSRWVHDNLGPETPIHFLRFHPDYKMMNFPMTPIETLERHYEAAKAEGLDYVYVGNVPGHPKESTYCPGCGKVLIGRYGYDILEYNIDKRNRCKFCGCKTPIIGPLSKSWKEDRFIPVVS